MSLIIFASLLVLGPLHSWAEAGGQTPALAVSVPATQSAEKAQPFGLSSPGLIAKIEKMFPEKDWKTFGFCGIHKDPLVTIRVPKFLKWNHPCTDHVIKDGVDYCGPDEDMSVLEGAVKIDGRERILRVEFDAFGSVEKNTPISNLPIYEATYGAFGALQEKGSRLLDGQKAEFAEVEDVQGRLNRPTKVLSRVDYALPYLGGKLFITETEKNGDTVTFVNHKDRVFQGIIDKILVSFKFKVDVNKPVPF